MSLPDDSAAARARIFANIDSALAPERGGAAPDAAAIAAEAAALISAPETLRPDFSDVTPLERFRAKATSERVTATIADIASLAETPAAVRAYLAEQGLAPRIALQPTDALTSLDWSGVETKADLDVNEPIAVSLADYAIAETGSVVFRSRADAPTLFSFLPLHHVVVVRAATILSYPEELWALMREGGEPQPRNVNIVTGTSGTADIEAKNVRGAHGPRHMRIILVGA